MAQRLEHDGRVQPGEGRSPHVLLHVQPREAELGRLLDHVDGEVLLLVPPRGVGRELGRREGARGVLDGGLVFVEGELHSIFSAIVQPSSWVLSRGSGFSFRAAGRCNVDGWILGTSPRMTNGSGCEVTPSSG